MARWTGRAPRSSQSAVGNDEGHPAGVEGRLLRAELLHQRGRGREAIAWLDAIGWHSVWELSHRAGAERQAAGICTSMEVTA